MMTSQSASCGYDDDDARKVLMNVLGVRIDQKRRFGWTLLYTLMIHPTP